MRQHRSFFTLPGFARLTAGWTLAFSLAVLVALLNSSTASACSAPDATKRSGALAGAGCTHGAGGDAAAARSAARRIASAAGGVSNRAATAAVGAAERVEREMRKDGAYESEILGCWRAHPAVECTAEVKGNDGYVLWRCVVQIRIQKRGGRHKSKLTDAVCVAEEAASTRKQRRTLRAISGGLR